MVRSIRKGRPGPPFFDIIKQTASRAQGVLGKIRKVDSGKKMC